MRTPLHPSGWPRAIAPPFTFTFSISNPRSLMQAMLCEANASFNSTRSRSFMSRPALCNAFFVAGTGPMPMIAGSTPATAMLTIFAIGFKPYFLTAASEASNIAAAPSLIPLLLPAVTVPSFINAGLSVASFSQKMIPWVFIFFKHRSFPFPAVHGTGMISSLNFPALSAASYFAWLFTANSSCASRLILPLLCHILGRFAHGIWMMHLH